MVVLGFDGFGFVRRLAEWNHREAVRISGVALSRGTSPSPAHHMDQNVFGVLHVGLDT